MKTKMLHEKEDHPDRFTAMFTDKKVYLGDASYPLGQLTVDILNLPDDTFSEFYALAKHFLTGRLKQLRDPQITITEVLVLETQEQWNSLIDFALTLPVMRDLRIDAEAYKTILPRSLVHDPEGFQHLKEPDAPIVEMLQRYIFAWIRIPDDILLFKKYIAAYLLAYAERLKTRDPESYAVAYYDFMQDAELQATLQEGVPDYLPPFSQRHNANVEFTAMPVPEDPLRYQLAERFEFSFLSSFLHVDFFKGLMAGNAPKCCHNCKKFFLLESGYHVCYCTNIAPGETERTCRQVGAHKKSAEKQGKTMAQAEYQKLYNRLKTRKNRGKISETEWNEKVAWAQKIKVKAEKGEMSEWDLKEMFEKV